MYRPDILYLVSGKEATSLYELFVLGQLMDQEMAGYQLRQALKSVVGQEQTVSYGVLYPLLERLSQAGDITLTTVETSQRPKKVATLTSQGRSHFQTLILAPVTVNKQSQLVFQIKCNFLHLLSVTDQRTVLQDFQSFTQFQLDNLRDIDDYLTTRPRMVPTDVVDARQVNQLQKARAQAQADWITARVARLDKGE
jgi:DNA-binding PadR family transcriptional regulator